MRKSSLYLITIGMLTAALAFATLSERRPVEQLHRPLEHIPGRIGAWRVTQESQLDPRVALKLNASSYISRTYSDGPNTVELFIAYYAFQRAGESMHSPKHCLPGAGWDISQHESENVPFHGETVAINRYSIQKGAERAVALYWYQSRDRVIANEYSAKFLFGSDALLKGRTAGSIVRILSKNDATSSHEAQRFAALVIPEMDQCLR